MTQAENANNSIAGPVLLMFLAAMAAAWLAYSTLFQQGILTFVIMLFYIPIVGLIAALLYRKLSRRV